MNKIFFLIFTFCFISETALAININDDIFKKAIENDSLSAVNNVINQGIDFTERNKQGDTVLLYVLENTQDLRVVKAIIDAGANVNEPSSDTGMTPLIYVTSRANVLRESALKMSVESRTNLSAEKMQKAIIKQMKYLRALLSLLIEKGADINQETPYGTPLMNASTNEWNQDLISDLLQAKAEVNKVDRFGRTALFYAQVNDCDKIIMQLLEAGADVSIKDMDGLTYLEIQKSDFNKN